MSNIFNTLEYTKGAEAIGIKREHAEYQALQMAKLIDDTFATKRDLYSMEKDIKNEIKDLKNEIKILEQRLLIKLGSLMIAGISILGFILKH